MALHPGGWAEHQSKQFVYTQAVRELNWNRMAQLRDAAQGHMHARAPRLLDSRAFVQVTDSGQQLNTVC